MNPAAGETPEQIRIDRAEGELAACGLFGSARHMAQQPSKLGAGEIRIEQKPGFCPNPRLVSRGFQLRTKLSGAAILPNDGAMHGAPGFAIPQQSGLAL